MSDQRFDRLETKLDDLGKALTKLVEIDTKLDHANQHNGTQDKRLDAHSQRLDKLAEAVTKNTGTSRVAERVMFVIIVAAVGFLARNVV